MVDMAAANFWANAQIHDAARGYLRMSIPPHVSDELRLTPGQKMKVTIEIEE